MVEADAGLQEAKRELKQAKIPTKKVGKTALLGDYASEWVSSRRLANSTIYGYEKIIRNHINPQLGNIPLEKLTSVRIARHYKELLAGGRKDKQFGKPLSSNTVNKVHIVLGSILESALDEGLIANNPAKRRRIVNAPTGKDIRAEKPEIGHWSAQQLHGFLTWNKEIMEDEHFTLWYVLANTGMRRSEALALKWSDLDATNNRISVRRAADTVLRDAVKLPKSGKARVIDIDDATVNTLKTWKQLRGRITLNLVTSDAYIFGTTDGRLRSPNEIGARWTHRIKRALQELPELNLTPIGLHGLRHSHASILMELGVNPKVVQERLGHSQITTTLMIYSHVTPTLQADAVAKFSTALNG